MNAIRPTTWLIWSPRESSLQEGTTRKRSAWAIDDPDASERTVTVARLELGKTFDREGQRERAVKQYDLVLSAPDVVGSRKEAAELRRKPYRGA